MFHTFVDSEIRQSIYNTYIPPHRASTSDFNWIGGTGRKAFTILFAFCLRACKPLGGAPWIPLCGPNTARPLRAPAVLNLASVSLVSQTCSLIELLQPPRIPPGLPQYRVIPPWCLLFSLFCFLIFCCFFCYRKKTSKNERQQVV